MAKKQPKVGRDFVQLAKKSDCVIEIREGKGSHVVVEFKDGTSVSIPVHGNRQLGEGILHKIIKAFKSAGVIGLVLLMLWFFSRMVW